MVNKIDIASPHQETFGSPAPLGLLGLAVGCASLIPIALGYGLTPGGFKTAAMICLFFGAGGQLLTGLMEFRNKNGFGGVIFTLFSAQWAMNAWELNAVASGVLPDHHVKLAIDITLLLILVPLTFGFGFFSKFLFYFLVDIDILFGIKIIKTLTGTTYLDIPLIIATLLLGGIAIWIALASLINPVAGKQIFRISGPLFTVKKDTFDWSRRFFVFETLFQKWKNEGFATIDFAEFAATFNEKFEDENPAPELLYLWDFGYIELDFADESKHEINKLRINAKGIDIYEQLILRKYEF